jgi:hypothetical protein
VRAIQQNLAGSYSELELAACSHELHILFSAGRSPTLGSLATKFVCLFLFLGTSVLSIRTVTQLLHDGASDRRTLERRLYLAISFLESVMIIEHTPKPSEYRLVIDRTGIVEVAMAGRKQYLRETRSCAFEGLLSRYDETFLWHLYEERHAALARVLGK